MASNPKRKSKKHCWHHMGITYTSYPTQHDERCCFCEKVVRIRGEFARDPDHGPGAPMIELTVTPDGYYDERPKRV